MNLLTQPVDTRPGASFEFVQEIFKPYGELDRVLSWCRTELIAEWRWQLVDQSSNHRPGRYIFYFDSDRDCVAFMLQWA